MGILFGSVKEINDAEYRTVFVSGRAVTPPRLTHNRKGYPHVEFLLKYGSNEFIMVESSRDCEQTTIAYNVNLGDDVMCMGRCKVKKYIRSDGEEGTKARLNISHRSFGFIKLQKSELQYLKKPPVEYNTEDEMDYDEADDWGELF